MPNQLDWSRFRLDALRSDVDARIKIAAARAQLAEASVDIAAKRLKLAADVEEQRRIRAAHKDFEHARKTSLSSLRRLKRTQFIDDQRLRDLKGLTLPGGGGDAIRRGWIAFKYFLRRIRFETIDSLHGKSVHGKPALAVFDGLRLDNAPASGETGAVLREVLVEMAEDVRAAAKRHSDTLLDLQKRVDSIRTADWKTAKLDTTWVS